MGINTVLTTEQGLKREALLLKELELMAERLENYKVMVDTQSHELMLLRQDNDDLKMANSALTWKYETIQLENKVLTEQVKDFKNKIFGSSSEKADIVDESQQELFSDDELGIQPIYKGDTHKIKVASHERVTHKPGPKVLTDNLRVEETVIEPEDKDEPCGCGAMREKIGEDVTDIVEYIPAEIFIRRIIRTKYACKNCEGTEDEDHPVVIQAPAPKRIIRSRMGENFIANVLVMRLADYMPYYRIKGMFRRLGYEICPQTLDKIQLTLYERLKPLERLLFNAIKKGNTLNVDETTIKLLNYDEAYKEDRSKSYIWVGTGGLPNEKAVVYRYYEGRQTSAALDFLIGFTGFLQTDALESYTSAVKEYALLYPNMKVIKNLCWAHTKRKFYEASKYGNDPIAAEGEKFIQKLYHIENTLLEANFKGQDLVSERHRLMDKLLEDFKAWLDEQQKHTLPQLKLGKAITYTLNGWTELKNVLDCPDLYLDNTVVERLIKKFVMHRKASLFCGNEKGARSTCLFMSLINTAKMHGLNEVDYLRSLFEQAALIPTDSPDEAYECLLPWNIEVTPFKQPTFI